MNVRYHHTMISMWEWTTHVQDRNVIHIHKHQLLLMWVNPMYFSHKCKQRHYQKSDSQSYKYMQYKVFTLNGIRHEKCIITELQSGLMLRLFSVPYGNYYKIMT